jgi:hypothetical protein
VDAVIINAHFGVKAGDRASLSKSCRTTLDTLYRHPIAHNLDWLDVVALFSRLGSVNHGTHNAVIYGVGDDHHRITKPHGKDLSADEVMIFRHMLTRAGWSPEQAATS